MKLYNNTPNFSIVVPGGCNANCSFCFWKQEKEPPEPEYLISLDETLKNLPREFKQVSITGGEPLLNSSRFLEKILNKARNRFEKVVLTTNGTNLDKHMDIISVYVNHINISRHSHDDKENKKIFQVTSIPDTLQLKREIKELNKKAVDVTLNCVLTESTFINEYVEFAQTTGASAVLFRKKHGDISPHPLEDNFKEFKSVYENSCPVCRSRTILIKGMLVHWKSSFTEPSQHLEEIYELIFHASGKLTCDWEGKINICTNGKDIFLKKNEQNELERLKTEVTRLTKIVDARNFPISVFTGPSLESCYGRSGFSSC